MRLAGGVAGGLFLAGAAITVAVLMLPHPSTVNEGGYWVLFAGQIVLGLLLLSWSRLGEAAQRWVAPLTIVGAIAAVTAGIVLNGERAGGPALLNEFFYVWPALYAGYFYGRRYTILVVVAIAASYGWACVEIGLATETIVTRALVTLTVVAGSAAVAMVLRVYVDALVMKLDRTARTDSLTNLINRRGFDEHLQRELAENRRTRAEPLSLLIGDIDRFKHLNDRFGHSAGDDALRGVGPALARASRAADVVARIGGEEFAVLMPSTRREEAVEAASRLIAAVAEVHDPEGHPIEISFGSASTEDPGVDDADALLRAADQALYAAKQRGRNQAVAFRAFGEAVDMSVPAPGVA